MTATLPCWNCAAPYEPQAAPTHCPACNVVVAPHPSATPFARLGLPAPRFSIEARALETAWLQRSRAVHPDRFSSKTPPERRAAAEQTAALNDAWRALREPFDRAGVLLKLAAVEEPKLGSAALADFMEASEEAETSAAAKSRVVEERSARFHEVMAAIGRELLIVDDIAGGYASASPELPRLRKVAALVAEGRTLARLVADLGGPVLVPTLAQR